MANPVSIVRKPLAEDSLSFQQLVAHGLELAQQCSGNLWTDYNEHDPGVTILEQCCYALTDLTHQFDCSVVELLSNESGGLDYQRLGLFPAHEILPVSPVTNDDLEALIMDRRRDVSEVYRVPDNTGSGLLSLEIIPKEVLSEEDSRNLKHKLWKLLDDNRILGEDIQRIDIARSVDCELHMSVELDHTVRAEKAIASVYYHFRQLLSPDKTQTPYHQISDVDGKVTEPLNQIIEGPLLRHGLVTNNLATEHGEIDIDDFYACLVQVDGISSGWDCRFICNQEIETVNGQAKPGELFAVPGGDAGWNCRFYSTCDLPQLNLTEGQEVAVATNYVMRVRLPTSEKHGKVVAYNESKEYININSDQVPLSWVEIEDRVGRLLKTESAVRDVKSDVQDIIPSHGNNRPQQNEYVSIQNHFPSSFGVGRHGKTSHNSSVEKNHLQRFKGYLLLLDQMMANFSEDITGLGQLYSSEIQTANTYYSKAISSNQLTGVNELYNSADTSSVQRQLDTTLSAHDDFFDRKNRILDYLLGLYGEQFSSKVFTHFSSQFPADYLQQEMLNKKARFLTNIVELSCRRGCVASSGITNLARRVSMKLGLADPVQPVRFNIKLLASDQGDITCASFDFDKKASNSIDNLTQEQIQSLENSMRNGIGPQTADAIRSSRFKLSYELHLLAVGMDSILYDLGLIPNEIDPGDIVKWYQQALLDTEQNSLTISQNNIELDSIGEPEAPLENPVEYVRIIENVLLRPRGIKDELTVLADDKPFYAHHITAVMPGWTRLFSQQSFRRLLTQTIEAECPAHLSVTTLWCGQETLDSVDQLIPKLQTERAAYFEGTVTAEQLNNTSDELRSWLFSARVAQSDG